MLFTEGGFYETNRGPRFWWIDPPTDAEIKDMVALLAHRVVRYLKRQGYFTRDEDNDVPDEDSSQNELFSEVQAASRNHSKGRGAQAQAKEKIRGRALGSRLRNRRQHLPRVRGPDENHCGDSRDQSHSENSDPSQNPSQTARLGSAESLHADDFLRNGGRGRPSGWGLCDTPNAARETGQN